MNAPDPLAALHPLRTPASIGWWPPAPGWWVLLVGGLLLLATLAFLWRMRYRKNAYRRRALSQLELLHTEFLANRDASLYLSQINALLKSVALLAYPRAEVAAQHGANWRAFLNRSLPPTEQLPPVIDDAAYQKSCPNLDMAQVHRAAELWIARHKGTP